MGEQQRSSKVMSPFGRRALALAVMFALWIVGLNVRLFQLQIVRYGEFLTRAQRQQRRTIEVSPKRGVIYDRNFRELAMSASVDSIFAVPADIPAPETVADLLGRVLGIDPAELLARMKGSRSFCWVKRKVDPLEAERVRALNLKGIYFQKESKRFYPKGELAAHILGYVGLDENGLAGVEVMFDKQVRGRPGMLLIQADARRRWYGRSERPPDPGENVVLTLDEKIQFIAERELAAAVGATRALAGTVVVMVPGTGEVLAMANRPTFNPNAYAQAPAEAWMNRAISAAYEPGSTFKLVTIAAALEEHLTRPDEPIDCQMGSIEIFGHRIHDHKPFGMLTVTQVIANSSDVGAIKLGLRLGDERMYRYMRALGFGAPTGIGLPGEARGLTRPPERWSKISIGAISMGQEVGVTPMQLLTAVSAIANGGRLVAPRIVRETFHQSPARRDGVLFAAPQGVGEAAADARQVLSPETANQVRNMMREAVVA
jgi:cell division protein FtsI (penicillin-binding protein 3)